MGIVQVRVVMGAMLAIATSGCTAAPGHEDQGAVAGSTAVPAGVAPLIAGVPPDWLPNDPCNPETDGWKPEPIPVTPDVQEQVDNGEPVLLTPPPGYQTRAPIGVPQCLGYGPPGKGTFQAECKSDADCPMGAVCPTGYDYCVTVCQIDNDCKPPAECLTDRLLVPFCGCRYESCSEDPVLISE